MIFQNRTRVAHIISDFAIVDGVEWVVDSWDRAQNLIIELKTTVKEKLDHGGIKLQREFNISRLKFLF